MFTRKFSITLVMTALFAVTAHAQVRVTVPEEDPGPPFYASLERAFVPHTDEWAAAGQNR